MRIYVAAWESRRSKGTSWLVVILNIVVPVARLGIATALPLLARARSTLKYHKLVMSQLEGHVTPDCVDVLCQSREGESSTFRALFGVSCLHAPVARRWEIYQRHDICAVVRRLP